MAQAQSTTRSVQTPILNIAYEESGNPQGFPIVLLHGFPDDVHAFDHVVPPLAKAGYRVLAPYLRGYGLTRFRDASTPRMAEQAAIGQDLIDFADALGFKQMALAGYDWGGRAAAIAAALHPERVRATVIIGGYTIQDVLAPPQPAQPEAERELWYQWYFNTERGRVGLAANRRALCKFLWQTWSPGWHFSDTEYDRTAPSFDNPDFVEVVIHSYRARYRLAAGDPAYESIERRLARKPPITVPTISLDGTADGVMPSGGTEGHRPQFTGPYQHRKIALAGHNVPQESPAEFAAAVRDCAKP